MEIIRKKPRKNLPRVVAASQSHIQIYSQPKKEHRLHQKKGKTIKLNFGDLLSTTIYETSASSFEQDVLNEEKPVVVEFFSRYCPYCRRFKPVYKKLAKKLEKEAKFVKLDVIRDEANREFAHGKGVWRVPTVEVFYHGKIIGNITGYNGIDLVLPKTQEFLIEKSEKFVPLQSKEQIHQNSDYSSD